MSTTHNITPTVKKNVVCSSSNRKLNFIKTKNNSKQNNQANQVSLRSISTKVASTIVSCDLQSHLWMCLYSGLPIAKLTRNLLTTRGTEEHVEQRGTRNTRKTRKTRTRGTRGIRGHEEYEDRRRSQNEINAIATLNRYKRGHTPRIQKGLRHPTLAWNRTQCSLLQHLSVPSC